MSWKIPLIVGITALILVLGTFAWVSDAPAYLGHEPATCNNCHVMDSQYENWFHAPHAEWAECADCHIPHSNLAAYYFYKGKSGMKDVFSFVTKSYSVAIRANAETKKIVQENCIRCHSDTVESIMLGTQPFERNCWECHRDVAHGERGASLTPYQDKEVYGK
jgi:cytochrome c nitrite reductase small subunit